MRFLYCATTNPGKIREFQLASDRFAAGVRIEMLPGIREIPAPEETGTTFEANAELKARYYAEISGLANVFADDSGISVDALGGAPGIYSARYAGEGASDEENRVKLLAEMSDKSDRAARFVCVIALATAEPAIRLFRGEVEGRLLEAGQGTGGFGYDPLFAAPPFEKTFAELAPEEKFYLSHRGKAFRALCEYLR